MKTIARIFVLLAVLGLGASEGRAQVLNSTPGCGSVTISGTGTHTLLYTNGGQNLIQLASIYYTTGSPASVSITLEAGNAPAATSAPFTKVTALTDTTSGDFGNIAGGYRYWYANLGTLTGGTAPTVVVSYCVRSVTSSTTPIISSTLGTATGTSLALTGALTAATFDGLTITTSTGTFTVTNGKTFAVAKTLTLTGTDSTTMTFPSTSATIARTDAANTFTGHQTIEGVTSTGATGTALLVFGTSPTLITPVIGAATGTSLALTGIVDGTIPVTITTGTTANLGATYKTGFTLNQEGTAGTGVTYTLPATALGEFYCVANSGTTGVVNIGALTVYPPASSFVINNGTVNTVGGGGTHGVASGGEAGDEACFGAIDATHWQVFPIKGTWTAN